MRGSADISTSATSTFSRAQRRALGIAEWDEKGSYHRVERLVLRVTEVLEGWSTIASTPAASDRGVDLDERAGRVQQPVDLLQGMDHALMLYSAKGPR